MNSRSAEILRLFQAATGDFNAGRFEIARESFRDLSSRFPESPQGQEAEYWVGDTAVCKKGVQGGGDRAAPVY